MQGCNFNCLTCHNPHTINHCNHCQQCVSSCPTGALSVKESRSPKHLSKQIKVVWQAESCTHCDACLDSCPHQSSPKIHRYSLEQVLKIIDKHRVFLNGITISGGEATLQLPFIIELFKAIKASPSLKQLSCFIDSNGSLSQVGWAQIMPYLDGAMIDLKSWQKETHQWLVGRDNHRVIQSMTLLAAHNKLHEVRLLHIPNKSDLDTEINAIAAFLNRLPTNVIVRLNAFQHHGVIGEARHWPKCRQQDINQLEQKLAAKIRQTIITPSLVLD